MHFEPSNDQNRKPERAVARSERLASGKSCRDESSLHSKPREPLLKNQKENDWLPTIVTGIYLGMTLGTHTGLTWVLSKIACQLRTQ